MRLPVNKVFWVVLLATLALLPTGVGAQKKPPTSPPTEIKKEQPPEAPNLAELILRANELSSRRAALQTKIAHRLDLPALEKGLQKIEASLAKYPPIIKQFKDSPSLNFDKIAAYKDTIRLNEVDLDKIIEPLTRTIKSLAAERKEWQAERKRWQQWESGLLKDEALEEIRTTFVRAQITIDSALLLINQTLQPLLALLQKSGDIGGQIANLLAELDGLTLARRQALLADETIPLFSYAYLTQLKNLTWFEVNRACKPLLMERPIRVGDYIEHSGQWAEVKRVGLRGHQNPHF